MDVVSEFPSDKEFAASENAFSLTSRAALDVDTEGPLEMAWDGHYLLDNGEGHQKYSDEEHVCCLNRVRCPGADVSHSVAARGTTEFGCFVSSGVVETVQCGDDEQIPRHTLTLARRYLVSDRDPRYATPLEDRLSSEAAWLPRPWEHLPLRLKRHTTAANGRSRGSKRKLDG